MHNHMRGGHTTIRIGSIDEDQVLPALTAMLDASDRNYQHSVGIVVDTTISTPAVGVV